MISGSSGWAGHGGYHARRDHEIEGAPTLVGRSGPGGLGPRRRAGGPVGVRAGPGVARRRHDQAALRAVHRRPRGRRDRRRRVHERQPGDRGGHRRGREGDAGGRRPRDPRGPPRAEDALGQPARPRAREVPVPDRADPPGAQPRVRRPRVDGLRQADQGEPRRRRAARRRTTSGTTPAGRTSSSTRSRAASRSRSASPRRSSRGTSRC